VKGFDWKAFDWTAVGRDGAVDWEKAVDALPYAAAMAACMQDEVYHAEGDVRTHTRLVGESLYRDPEFAALPPERRNALALAVLWHDVAKPETRTEEFDEEAGRVRVSHPYHAPRGAFAAWRDLWRAGLPLSTRLSVFAMVMGHQQIFRVLKHEEPRVPLARIATLGSVYDLSVLAAADDRGRICNAPKIGEDLALTRMLAEENGCLHGPWPFASDTARAAFGRDVKDALFYDPQPPRGSRVIVLSGLPGSGKDTYVNDRLKDYAHVSLDLVREELDVDADENQGRVSQRVQKTCREHLAGKRDFVFNATNLSRLQRSKIVSLAFAYDARVEIHALDVPETEIRKSNRARAGRAAVPDQVIDRMISKWEPPTPLEAHAVTWLDRSFRPIPVNRPCDNEAGTSPPGP
jgi:predicted kinase